MPNGSIKNGKRALQLGESISKTCFAYGGTARFTITEECRKRNRKSEKLKICITLDLDANDMTTELSFGIRHKLSVSAEIPDPNQSELALKE